MYFQGGGEKLLNEAILNWDFTYILVAYLKTKVGPRCRVCICVSNCSVAAELREITSMGVCSVGREHCSTAALQLDSWDTAAGDTLLALQLGIPGTHTRNSRLRCRGQ